MNTFKKIFVAVLAGLALSSCVTNELVPEFAQKNVAFGKKVLNVAKQGETQVVAISANADWTLSTDAEWVKLAPMSGTSATKSITVTVDEENTTDDVRTAKVIIASLVDSSQSDTLTVNQSNAEAGGKIVDAETFLLFMEAAGSFTEADVVEVAADVDLGGIEVTPAAKFAGVLEGNNHSIYNFTVKSTLSAASLIVENAGTIKNLKIGTANGTTPDGKTEFTFASGAEGSAAGIVGINSGLMENVSNFATVNFNATSPASTDAGIGGVAGLFGGPNAKLVNCHNYGTVTFTGTLNYRGMIGGVLGLNAQAGTEVSGCVNHADLVQANKTQKEFTMGGVIGRSNTQMYVKDCVNEGAVTYSCTEKPGSYLHIAGIIGAEYSGAEISNCVNKGPVSSCIDQVNRMGGIVGTMNSNGKVINCRNEASLTLEQSTNANWQSVGGIVGFEEKCTMVGEEKGGSISGSVNNGIITVKIDNATTHANQVCAGGVIGITCSHFAVTGNTNNANISFTNTSGSNTQVGGIVGWDKTTASIVEDNENKGEVTISAANGFAGGILGKADVAASSVKNNTNLGTITGTTAGSIAGSAEAALTSCAVGGTVNGTVLTAGNFSSYIQGAGSGAPVACYFPGASVQDYVSAAPAALVYVAAGEAKTVTVAANCAWTAVSSEAWLTLSDAEGNGEGSVILSAAENTTYSERTATVTFTSKNDATVKAVVTATQAAKVDGLAGNKITSAADFKTFLVLAPDAVASDTFTLEADVDYSSEVLIPAASFAGILDGKGHKITLKVDTGDYDKLAIIQTLTGTVKNLVVDGSIKDTYAGNTEYSVASVAAVVDGGHVENCINNATITDASTSTGGYANVGGVIAYLKGDGASITDCTNNGKLTVANACQTIFGGVAAYGQTNSSAPTLTFRNLVNTADVDINHSGANWDYIGGVIGKMGASSNPFALFTVSGCKFSGNLNIIKAPKIRGGGVFGSCGVSTDYDISNNEFAGKVNITSTEAVDRLIGGVGPGFSEAAATGTISNCVFNGVIEAVDGGNLYLGGIYGNNGSANIVIDGCKATSKSAIRGFTTAKSIGVIAARPNKDGFTVKNCKIAGVVTTAAGETITIAADNIEDWMFKGSATATAVTLENNGFNAE